MDAKEFQVFAEAAVKSAKPIDCRNAISRCYYAVLHVAADFLSSMGIQPPKSAQKHTKVPLYLGAGKDNEISKVAYELNGLKARRNNADYDLDDKSVENAQTARTYVIQAKRNIDALDRCATDPARCAVISAAIKSYKRDVLREP